MVRTYAGVNASTSRVGELFDLVFNENQLSTKATTQQLTLTYGATMAGSSNTNRPSSVPLELRQGGWSVATVKPSRRHNPSYYDYERQMRQQDRHQRQQYMQDLQRQSEEQREQRLRNEIALGGHEFEKELLKHQLRERRSFSASRDEYGSMGPAETRYYNGNGYGYGLGNTNYGTDYEKYLRAAELQHKREYAMALQQQQHQQNHQPYDYRSRPPLSIAAGTGGYTPTFAAATSAAAPPPPLVAAQIRRERSVPDNLNLFDESSTYDPLSLNYSRGAAGSTRRQAQAQLRKQASQDPDEPAEIYDPWGKGGAGAPIRDRNGRLITDRRLLQKSWHSMLDSNLPHDSSQNRSTLAAALHQYNQTQHQQQPLEDQYPAGDISSSSYPGKALVSTMSNPIGGLSEKDYYKEELRKQIEEQKRLRELEKEKERLEDERDRLRIEREADRQRREIEDERRKQQLKAERGLRRAEQAMARSGAPPLGSEGPAQKVDGGGTKRAPPPDDGLEWWERQPQTSLIGRSSSAHEVAVGTRNARRSPPTRQPPDGWSPRDHPQSPAMKQSPRDHLQNTLMRRSPVAMEHPRQHTPLDRRLSSPNPNLERNQSSAARNEQIMRQLSAMRERLNKEQMRVRSAMRRRDYSDDLFEDDGDRPRHSSTRRPLGDHLHKTAPLDLEDDDPPLVKLIKNSRTFEPGTLRRPPPLVSSYGHSKTAEVFDQSPGSDRQDSVIDHYIHQRNGIRQNQNGY